MEKKRFGSVCCTREIRLSAARIRAKEIILPQSIVEMRGSEQINVSCVIVRTRLREIDRANTEVQGVNIDNIREQLITIANSRTKRNGWRVGVTMKVKEVMIFFDDIYCIPINSFRKKEIVSPREDAKSH